MTSATSVSKLTAYAILGGAPDGVTLSKLTTYAIKGGVPNGASVSRLTAYAITGPVVVASALINSGFLMF